MTTQYSTAIHTHSTSKQMRQDAYRIRHETALAHNSAPLRTNRPNGDEQHYPSRIANFSKTLPHNHLGEVVPAAYEALLKALSTGQSQDFEQIPMGSSAGKLVDPQGAVTFSMERGDSHDFAIPTPLAFASSEMAAEMVELYWMALTRDIHFDTYDSNDVIEKACIDLSRLSDYRAPKLNGKVVPSVIFRGTSPGEHLGPFISQFLLLPIPSGVFTLEQRFEMPTDKDFMINYDEWLRIQNGQNPAPSETLVLQKEYCYMRNGRDLAHYVQRDFPFQAFLNAGLILIGWQSPLWKHFLTESKTRSAFVNFGVPMFLDWVAKAALEALKATWHIKWHVHRRIRPEAYSGRVHNCLAKQAIYPMHSDLLKAEAVAEVQRKHGSYLLPMAYPEGAPAHPAYPAGHAAFAGACATVIKAIVDGSAHIHGAKRVNRDGTALEDYTGPALTIEGELNKLAANIAYGRNIAGVHWRTDGSAGLLLGEQVAVQLMNDLIWTLPERIAPIQFRGFSGDLLTVGA